MARRGGMCSDYFRSVGTPAAPGDGFSSRWVVVVPDSGAGAGGLFDHWQVVRPLAACKAPVAGQPVIGRPIAGPGPPAAQVPCSCGDRGHLFGGVTAGGGAVVGTSDTVWGAGTGHVVSGVATWCLSPHFVHRLSVRVAGICSARAGAQGAGFGSPASPPRKGTPRTSGRGSSPSFQARQLPERLAEEHPGPCRHTSERLRDSCVPSLVGVVWVQSRNLFRSRRDAEGAHWCTPPRLARSRSPGTQPPPPMPVAAPPPMPVAAPPPMPVAAPPPMPLEPPAPCAGDPTSARGKADLPAAGGRGTGVQR
ncbi:hypothetical protein EV648_11062 [Kribbella sp. VKM Ac-2568]|nr:hypothetical protein EV648_11062 [Kribbella sp. VKM Ac-2568]